MLRDGLLFYVIAFTRCEDSEEIPCSGRLYIESERQVLFHAATTTKIDSLFRTIVHRERVASVLPHCDYHEDRFSVPDDCTSRASLATGRVELSLNVKGREEKAARIMVIKRLPDTRFYVTRVEYAVNYNRFGDRWHYDYSLMRNNLSSRKGKSFFRNNYVITGEMAVTAHNEASARMGADERLRFKDFLSEKADDLRDDDFRGDHNAIEPDKSIDAVIHRMIRRLEHCGTH